MQININILKDILKITESDEIRNKAVKMIEYLCGDNLENTNDKEINETVTDINSTLENIKKDIRNKYRYKVRRKYSDKSFNIRLNADGYEMQLETSSGKINMQDIIYDSIIDAMIYLVEIKGIGIDKYEDAFIDIMNNITWENNKGLDRLYKKDEDK